MKAEGAPNKQTAKTSVSFIHFIIMWKKGV